MTADAIGAGIPRALPRASIRDIVFDIGRVFVEIEPRPLLELLAAHSAACTDLQSLIAAIALDEHECGRLASAELIERIGALAARPISPELVRSKWLDMFTLAPEMVRLAQGLSSRYRIYLLSNVGELHWDHLCREYELHRLAHDALPSFVAGVMKPDAAIYAHAERRFGLDPPATVFIDDRAENIAAAASRGWRGVRHESYAATLAALRELGVEA